MILLLLTPEPPKIPLLDEIDQEKTVSTCRNLHFSSPVSRSTEGSTISDLTLNSDLFPDSTLVGSTIGSQHTDEKEGSEDGKRYKSTVRGYCNRMLPNGRRQIGRTIWFCSGCTKCWAISYKQARH